MPLAEFLWESAGGPTNVNYIRENLFKEAFLIDEISLSDLGYSYYFTVKELN